MMFPPLRWIPNIAIFGSAGGGGVTPRQASLPGVQVNTPSVAKQASLPGVALG